MTEHEASTLAALIRALNPAAAEAITVDAVPTTRGEPKRYRITAPGLAIEYPWQWLFIQGQGHDQALQQVQQMLLTIMQAVGVKVQQADAKSGIILAGAMPN